MADKTGIEWTDATWNPVAGCSLVSPGCTNCYAMKHANRLLDRPGSHYEGTTQKNDKGAVTWTGKIARAPGNIFEKPLAWKRPRMVFVNSMSDLFHEDVPYDWAEEIFAIMALCPHHTFQVLTKRPDCMQEFLSSRHTPARITAQMFTIAKRHGIDMPSAWPELYDADGYATRTVRLPLPNVWIGTSVEDQRRAQDRIRPLLRTPAAVRFLSLEPLLGPVELNALSRTAIKDPGKASRIYETCLYTIADRPVILPAHDSAKIDWVIVGGESGPKARPMHPDWVRNIRDNCKAAGTAFFFKQWGSHAPLDRDDIDDLPENAFVMCLDGHINDVHDPINTMDEFMHGTFMVPMDKKKAGNMLDGQTWTQMPTGRGQI